MGKDVTPGSVAGQVVFCLCGPKGSLCCFILSFWGTLMLFLLGAFYYVEAVVLLEDIITKVPAVNETARTGYTYFSSVTYYDSQDITDAYKRAAYSCWGAGVIYVLFLILSGSFIGINVWRAKAKANQ